MYTQTCMHACLPACMLACIHTYMQICNNSGKTSHLYHSRDLC